MLSEAMEPDIEFWDFWDFRIMAVRKMAWHYESIKHSGSNPRFDGFKFYYQRIV